MVRRAVALGPPALSQDDRPVGAGSLGPCGHVCVAAGGEPPRSPPGSLRGLGSLPGLVTPNSETCRIYVDGTPYVWKDGEGVVFDETYSHKAKNESDQDRIILFCDVERPLRGWLPTRINRFMCRHVLKAGATENLPGDKVGILNRLFHYAYQVRLATKAVRERSKPLSYGLKYLGVLAVLYWLLR